MCVTPMSGLSLAGVKPKQALPFLSPALALASKGKSKPAPQTPSAATAGGY